MSKLKVLSLVLAVLLVLPLLPTGLIASAADTVKGTYTYGDKEYVLYTGFTKTAGTSGYNTSENPDKLVDNNLETKWCCSASSGVYIEFYATNAFVPFGYIFRTAGDSQKFYNRNPKSWTIKAKAAEGDDWTTIATVSDDTTFQAANNTDYAFSIDYSGENAAKLKRYQYFRIELTVVAISGVDDGNKKLQLSEFRFFGLDNPVVEITARAATCTAIGYSRNCYYYNDTYYADEAHTQPLAASSVEIPMIAHTLVHHAAVAHTATTNGNIEYWQCSVCGKYFADANAATEITERDTIDWAPCAYIDENGASAAHTGSFTTVSATDTAWTDGWYVVRENTTVDSRVTVTGTVNLVLCNGATLTIGKGVNVPYDSSSPNTFNVYAQSADADTMGALTAQNVDNNNAAIGGNNNQTYGNINIYGGKLTLKSGSYGAAIGTGNNAYTGATGTILIAGGIVSVPEGNSYGAGIGGGEYSAGGNIVITGGVIDVKGGSHSAGIGGCDEYNGGNITITGGKITARAGNDSAAIGGGDYWGNSSNLGGRAGTITITGGEITTYSNNNGTGIGDSYSPNTSGASSVTIALSQGSSINTQSVIAETVTFNGNHSIERNGTKYFADANAAALGGLIRSDDRTVYTVSFVDSDGTTVISTLTAFSGDATPAARVEPIKAGYVFDKWTKNGVPYDFSTPVTENITLKASYTAAPALTYLDETGSEVTTSSYYTLGTMTDLSGLPAGIYTTPVDLTYNNRIVFAENAVLVLQNGTTLTANNGIEVKPGASLTIFAQSVSGDQTEGKLVARTKDKNYPGIGYAEQPLEGDTIAIYGGNIDAKASYDYGAGIGGGRNASATVVIGGGTINAVGGYDGAGIGGGYLGNGSVTVTGGTVVAKGGTYGAGIGGGYNRVGNVTITGGSVTAESGSSGAAGIGCGNGTNGGSVTITGGQVTVNSRSDTYGIGGMTAGGSTAISLGAVSNSDFIVSPIYRGTVTFNHALRLRDAEETTLATTGNIAGQVLISADIENVTVTFVDEDGTTVISAFSIVPGNKVTAPQAPDKTADFKTFTGWYANGSAVDVTAPFYDTVTLTATYAQIPMPQGEGTSSSPYLIASADDWNKVAAAVITYGFSFENCYFKLTNSITVSTMIGTSTKMFSGIFDGDGKTLTLNIEASENFCAPFRYVENVTIRNLAVTGTITNSGKQNAGLIGSSRGDAVIYNCKSSVIINTTFSGDASNGGFIAEVTSGTATFTGCAFTGKLLGSSSNRSAGFVGWNAGTMITYIDCLVDPTEITMGASGSATFNRNSKNAFTNCYYVTAYGDAQGKQAKIVSADENVTLDLASKTVYNVSGITASTVGMIYDGHLYAGKDDTVVLTAATSLTGNILYGITSGSLTADGSTLTVTVNDNATVITASFAQAGTENDPILIASADDWNNVAAAVNYGISFEGCYFKLTNNITVTTKIGSKDDSKPFSGVFDGDGKTITLDLAADDKQGNAPFHYVQGATIKNLIVGGVVHASAYHASALVGFANGVTIENCLVNAQILFARNMTSAHSGSFIGHALSAAFTMTGCAFTGSIGYEAEGSGSASGLTNVGGLVGWDDASTPTITNCLNAGTFASNPTKIAPIARVNGRGTVTNCYTTVSGISCQGSQTDNRGDYARTITAGENVSLDFASKTVYNVSGITASTVGMIFDGQIYAANGEAVVLTATYTGTETGVDLQYTTTAGEISQSGSTLTLNVSGDATVNVRTGVFYNVNIADGIQLGSVSVDKSVVESGETVTVTVNFGGNNDLTSLTVLNGDESLTLTKTSETTWTFVMPEAHVTVNASFVAALANGTGTAADPYRIANVHDWNVFARLVNTGSTGLCATQTANITGITSTVGTNDKRYSGTYDGAGYTLTVNLTATGEACAPFAYTSGATIMRVHTAGTIVTAHKYAGGIIGRSYGTTKIFSSVSSVYIDSSVAGDGSHGGLVGAMEGTLTINNCLFNGRIGSSSTNACGGIVGWKGGTLNVKNTLVAPEMIYVDLNNCATIARNGGSFENCYYKTQIGTEQGTAVGEMTEAQLVTALGGGWTLKDGEAWPITDEKNIRTATVTVYNLVYTGEVLTPPVTVTDLLGNELTVGTDYTLTISPATVKEVGTYTVTVTGTGNYTGSTTATFNVQLRDPHLTADGNDWYVNMIANGTITIDLRNETRGFTFKIYDASGKNGSYSNYNNGSIVITIPEGYKLKISGSGDTESGYDFLYIRNANGELLGYNYESGSKKGYCGNRFTVEELTAEGSVTVAFTSDSSINYSGFELTATLEKDVDAYDLNEDGSIDILDVTELLNALSNGETIGKYDLNGDGNVDIQDVTELLNVLSGS